MMSHNNSPDSDSSSSCCPETSAELKLYRSLIFSVLIVVGFALFILVYCFFIRRRPVGWPSLRLRSRSPLPNNNNGSSLTSELGLKKELREMLPIIVYKETFSIKDTLCSVCLGDYEADDRLQQIPACGHAFHIECIDLWLASQATCPLCRLSILPLSNNTPEYPTTNQA